MAAVERQREPVARLRQKPQEPRLQALATQEVCLPAQQQRAAWPVLRQQEQLAGQLQSPVWLQLVAQPVASPRPDPSAVSRRLPESAAAAVL